MTLAIRRAALWERPAEPLPTDCGITETAWSGDNASFGTAALWKKRAGSQTVILPNSHIRREITSLLGKWTVSYMRDRSGVMVCISLNGWLRWKSSLHKKPLIGLTRFGVDGRKSVAVQKLPKILQKGEIPWAKRKGRSGRVILANCVTDPPLSLPNTTTRFSTCRIGGSMSRYLITCLQFDCKNEDTGRFDFTRSWWRKTPFAVWKRT